ncbi:MAG: hypothetical protein H7145_12545 [Akkermansiaceae bacterium]|nr:hypothetical protein [Armatimonadota bacterium]
MKAETYLRRALFAPIIVPLLAALTVASRWFDGEFGRGGMTNEIADYTAMFLIYSLLIGGIPYLWMLYTRRDFLRTAPRDELVSACYILPIVMLPFYWKFWGTLSVIGISVIGIVTVWPAYMGGVLLVLGTFAVPILGYLYLALTIGFLRAFQWLGLIE